MKTIIIKLQFEYRIFEKGSKLFIECHAYEESLECVSELTSILSIHDPLRSISYGMSDSQ